MGNIIDVDHTILIQLANFLITIVVLNYLLIKPVRKQIADRRAFADAQTAQIDTFTNEANAKLSSYEAALADARAQASANREARRAEGLAEEQALLQTAQHDAQRLLRTSREEIKNESQVAMGTLLSQVDALAAKAAAKIFN